MKLISVPSILLILLFVFSSVSLSSQPFYGAVSAGINLTQVDGDEVYGFDKVGFNGGPAVIWPFGKGKKMSLTMELLYSQLGSYRKDYYSNNDSVVKDSGYYDGYRLKLDYVQIPLMFHYTDKDRIAGGFGILYGQLVSSGEWEDHNDQYGMRKTDPVPDSLKFNKYDIQALADVRVRLYKHLWFNVRYSYSIVPIRTREFINPFPPHTHWTRKQYNNVITLRLTYIFNEPLPSKEKKKPRD